MNVFRKSMKRSKQILTSVYLTVKKLKNMHLICKTEAQVSHC